MPGSCWSVVHPLPEAANESDPPSYEMRASPPPEAQGE